MDTKLKVRYLPIGKAKPADYNPRKWSKKAIADLTEGIKKYGMVDLFILNSAPKRKKHY